MNETFRLLLSLSVSGSILALLIFAIKPFIRHKLSKSIQYYIWIVVVLRLILPFSFEESIMNNVFYGDQKPLIITSSQGQANTYPSPVLPNVQGNVSNGTYNNDADHSRYFSDLFSQYVFYIWLLGVFIALAVNLNGYTRFSKHLKQSNRPAADEDSRVLATLLKGRKNVRLARNPFAVTPMLIGILRPLIIIPDISFTEKQLKNILLHEVVHLKRFDVGIKWLTMIAVSLHWFNPLVYFIKREINHAC
ncbi:MAG: M56 family metallopeptidase, partial [Syntrophomonas sp.]